MYRAICFFILFYLNYNYLLAQNKYCFPIYFGDLNQNYLIDSIVNPDGTLMKRYWDTSNIEKRKIDVGIDVFSSNGDLLTIGRSPLTDEPTYTIVFYDDYRRLYSISYGVVGVFNIRINYYYSGRISEIINYNWEGNLNGWNIIYDEFGNIRRRFFYLNNILIDAVPKLYQWDKNGINKQNRTISDFKIIDSIYCLKNLKIDSIKTLLGEPNKVIKKKNKTTTLIYYLNKTQDSSIIGKDKIIILFDDRKNQVKSIL